MLDWFKYEPNIPCSRLRLDSKVRASKCPDGQEPCYVGEHPTLKRRRLCGHDLDVESQQGIQFYFELRRIYMMTWVFSPSMERNPDPCSPSLMYAGKETVPSTDTECPCSMFEVQEYKVVVKQRERPPTGCVHFGLRLLGYARSMTIHDQSVQISRCHLFMTIVFASGSSSSPTMVSPKVTMSACGWVPRNLMIFG